MHLPSVNAKQKRENNPLSFILFSRDHHSISPTAARKKEGNIFKREFPPVFYSPRRPSIAARNEQSSILLKRSEEIHEKRLQKSEFLLSYKETGQKKRENSLQRGIFNLIEYGSQEKLFGDSPTILSTFEKVKARIPKAKYAGYPGTLVLSSRRKKLLKNMLMDTTMEIFQREKQAEDNLGRKKQKGFSFVTEEIEKLKQKSRQKTTKREEIQETLIDFGSRETKKVVSSFDELHKSHFGIRK